jgi:hypothetical protein
MRAAILILVLILSLNAKTQQKPYYYQIPDAPSSFTPNNVAARMVDGLGFRYFWATEGLTEKDLAYKPSKDARTSLETIEHINGLVEILVNTVSKKSTKFDSPPPKLSFVQMREKTLKNIQTASDLLKKSDAKLEDLDMIFEQGSNKSEFPFWNLINGPISDALWHVGQVVTFRRSSGNPLPNGVNVLTGTKSN